MQRITRSLAVLRSFAGMVALALGIVGPGHVTAQTAAVPVRVAYIPTANLLPALVANDKGIFQQNGLAVTLTVAHNTSLLPAALGKQLDIAISTLADLLKASASGLDVVTICGSTYETASNRNVELIVRKDSGIASIKDLKGKIIAAPTIGAGIHSATLYWLKKNGIDANAVRAVEVPFPNMADQLNSKRVDAVEAIQPFVGPMLAAGNITLGNPNLEISDPSIQTIWIAQGIWARANPKVVLAWSTSLKSATDFIKKNPGEARAILAKYTHLPDAVVQRIPFPLYETAITPQDLGPWIKVLTEMGQLSGTTDAGKLVVTGN